MFQLTIHQILKHSMYWNMNTCFTYVLICIGRGLNMVGNLSVFTRQSILCMSRKHGNVNFKCLFSWELDIEIIGRMDTVNFCKYCLSCELASCLIKGSITTLPIVIWEWTGFSVVIFPLGRSRCELVEYTFCSLFWLDYKLTIMLDYTKILVFL